MTRLFDISAIKTTDNHPGDKSAILRDNYLKMHEFKVESLKQLNGRLPNLGEFFAIWTLKSFNAFTFIPYLIQQHEIIEDLVLSTYSINMRITDSLIKKIDQGKIKKVSVFISDSMKHRMPKVVDHLSMLTQSRNNIEIHYDWNHSKVTLVKAGGFNYVIEGSGNWSENAQFEQYLFFNHKRLYDFRLKCILYDLHKRGSESN
jgi:hypothetical protein